MITAKAMRDISDAAYIQRYNDFFTEVERTIKEAAQNGYYRAVIEYSNSFCDDWKESPIAAYREELIKLGYKVDMKTFGVQPEMHITWKE